MSMTTNLPHGEELRIRQQIAWDGEQMERIVKAADGRDLTHAQAADFEKHYRESRRLLGVIGVNLSAFASEGGVKVAEEASRQINAWATSMPGDGEPRAGRPDVGGSHGFGIFSTREHRPGEVTVLTPEQRMSDFAEPGAPGTGVSMGRYLRGVITGDWDGLAPELRAMSVGNDVSAGYLVPSAMSLRVIDKARDAATVMRAGAQTIPMDGNELTIARLVGDPTGTWHQENQPVADTDMTFEAVRLRAKTVVAIVKSSLELFEDATELGSTIEDALGAALALEIDRAALMGTGAAGEPLGILNQPGVTVTGSIGSPTSYVPFADTPTMELRTHNAAEPYSFISSPRTFNSLGKIVTGIASDKTRLAPPPDWIAYQKYSSNQIPINLGGASNESLAFIGDFRQLIVGSRKTLTVEASREAGDASGGAFTSLQVWIRAYMRLDIALAHPDHFNVLTGILA